MNHQDCKVMGTKRPEPRIIMGRSAVTIGQRKILFDFIPP